MRRVLSLVLAATLVVAALVVGAIPAAASIPGVSPLDEAVNGQILDDEWADGPGGFTLSGLSLKGNPKRLVAYDTRVETNGDANDLNPAGQSIGENIAIIEQETGNDADNGLECQCIPDDAIGGSITIDFNSPVVAWSSNFLDVENEEGPDSRLRFIETATGTATTIGFEELRSSASPYYQGPDFVLGNALAQVMTNPITAAQIGHAFDTVVFDLVGSEALGSFTWTNALLTVGSTVFADVDDDGVQDAGEPGIPGVAVELQDESGTTVATTTTDADGNYFIDAADDGSYLLPGGYVIVVEQPDGYDEVSSTATPADDEVDGTNDATQAAPGDDATTGVFQLGYDDDPAEPAQGGDQDDGPFDADGDMTIDVGFVPTPLEPAALGDYVWSDEDGDGVQDDDEPGVAGVTVNLWTDDDADGAPDTQIDSTTTDADGNYLFDELDPLLTYVVQFVAPDGTVLTVQDAGSDDALDSDADPASGITGPITLEPGETDLTVDAGLVTPPAAIGDTVFLDEDEDGTQDDGEPGVPEVTVNLWISTDGDCVPDEQIATTTTDANGEYLFDGLDPDLTYVVQVVAPDGTVFTIQDAGGDDALDSDVDADGITTCIEVDPGQTDLTNDAGLVPAPAAIGDTVFLDEDEDGTQDDGEPGVPEVTVNLWISTDGDCVPDEQIATTTTDANGEYLFDGLDPDLTYVVQVVAPDGTVFTIQDAGGDDALDSDVDADGITTCIEVDPGQTDLTNDAGLVIEDAALGQIGDYVWFDTNADGVQDDDEDGLVGVGVSLLDEDGNVVATTATDADGLYIFDELPPGTYTVVLDAATAPAADTSSFDPDGGDPLRSTTSIGVAGIDLEQDFGFTEVVLTNCVPTPSEPCDPPTDPPPSDPPPSDPPPSDPPPGDMARTGVDTWLLVLVALGLLGTGAGISVAGGRRPRRDGTA